ncbi:unnamed protein product [Clonostachys solani]|uniref:Uncharacterized protein n=1 Tax=Clonostachys solani TaxID=160281 RepID=A0A9N9Z0M0_9HYPO|nr:unnamed protein product [Clonostachys solani]
MARRFMRPLSLLSLIAQIEPLAAFDCNSNATISSIGDAKELRENCRILRGDLSFTDNITETINLDGLEEVHGVLYHVGCPPYDSCLGATDELFDITSSTLSFLGDGIYFWNFRSLGKLNLPNLKTVNSSIYLQELPNLTHVDFTNLETLTGVKLDVSKLEEWKQNGLKNYTGSKPPYISLPDLGNLKSIDSLFASPIDPFQHRRSWQERVDLLLGLNKLRNFTFGWSGIDKLTVRGEDLTVTFGASSSEKLEAQEIIIGDGVTKVVRGPKMANFTTESFSCQCGDLSSLEVPVDLVHDVYISGGKLESVQLPVAAEKWKDVSLSLYTPRILMNSTKDLDGNTIWHWPKEEMRSLTLAANITTDFL